MGTTNIIYIISAEALALCLFIITLLFVNNRKLRQKIRLLKAKLDKALKRSAAEPLLDPRPQEQEAITQRNYLDFVESEIEATQQYHYDQGSRQDIALDLDPDAPLNRRTAALRNAFLIAEKEASSNEAQFGWDLLATRYQQLLDFNNDFAPQRQDLSEEVQQLNEALELAQKRIQNLERFKALYFELEEKWSECSSQAEETYAELKNMADKESSGVQSLIEAYHASYESLGQSFTKGMAELNPNLAQGSDGQLREIRRLQEVAADQHRIIKELQGRLAKSETPEERTEIIQGLQNELDKQARFLQESETCIKLMEDELTSANQEIEELRSRTQAIEKLRNTVLDHQTKSDRQEQIIDSLKSENRRLAQKLKVAAEAPPEDNQEAKKLRKELTSLQSKYNDLEEKFLNLKLKG